jgi:hypothetical protein
MSFPLLVNQRLLESVALVAPVDANKGRSRTYLLYMASSIQQSCGKEGPIGYAGLLASSPIPLDLIEAVKSSRRRLSLQNGGTLDKTVAMLDHGIDAHIQF